MADIYEQDGKYGKYRLKVNTVLDNSKFPGQSDPFLLVAVLGDEYISQPFKFTLTFWRDMALGHVHPELMINSKVMFGIDIKKYRDQMVITAQGAQLKEVFIGQSYVYRCGVIEEFWYESAIDGRFFQYKATIIPRFAMLKYDVRYAIWQDKTFLDILQDFEDLVSPELKFDKTRLDKSDFPKMEYCVHFDESSFNFLSRLMQRFGVWYYIDHNTKTIRIP